MTDFQLKFRLIFLRYLLIAICFIGAYTFLNWYIVLNKQLVQIDEIFANFVIPFFLPLAPVLIWLRPRLKLLQFTIPRSGKNPANGYIMIAVFAIGATAAIAQSYVTTATGKLTRLESIDQIIQHPKTKYYQLQHYYISKQLAKTYRERSVSSKGSRLTWYNYFACPIFNDSITHHVKLPGHSNFVDTARFFAAYPFTRGALIIFDDKPISQYDFAHLEVARLGNFSFIQPAQAIALYGNAASKGAVKIMQTNVVTIIPVAWLCYRDSKEVSNRLSQPEKDTLYKYFYKDSYNKFLAKNLNSFDYLDRIGYNAQRSSYKSAINYPTQFSDDPIILVARQSRFEDRNGYFLIFTLGAFAAGALIFYLMLLKPAINKASLSEYLPQDPGDFYNWKNDV